MHTAGARPVNRNLKTKDILMDAVLELEVNHHHGEARMHLCGICERAPAAVLVGDHAEPMSLPAGKTGRHVGVNCVSARKPKPAQTGRASAAFYGRSQAGRRGQGGELDNGRR